MLTREEYRARKTARLHLALTRTDSIRARAIDLMKRFAFSGYSPARADYWKIAQHVLESAKVRRPDANGRERPGPFHRPLPR